MRLNETITATQATQGLQQATISSRFRWERAVARRSDLSAGGQKVMERKKAFVGENEQAFDGCGPRRRDRGADCGLCGRHQHGAAHGTLRRAFGILSWASRRPSCQSIRARLA